MPAVVADQRRQRVPIDPDQRAAGIARQPPHGAGTVRASRTMMNASWAACCDRCAYICGGSKAGNLRLADICATVSQISHGHSAHCSKGRYGRYGSARLPFHNASMTESCCVSNLAGCRSLVSGLGEGTKLRLLRSLDLRGWALVGAAASVVALPGAVTTLGNSAQAGATLEERKLPMQFSWVACQPNCRAGSARSASSPPTARRISTISRAAASSTAPPSCWIPAAARSTTSIALGRRFREPRRADHGRHQRA